MIKIENLTKRYNNILALDSINLLIPGENIIGIIGPNGAGKSTLINILVGIVLKTSGSIKILNYDIKNDGNEIKKIIGVMPEYSALFEGLSGFEHLKFVAQIYEMKTDVYIKRIDELLRYFELYFAKDRLIETYSQGMKKKLAFISAIIHDPVILFLDEPFENVDPVSRKKMKDVLKKMRENGKTIIITSHALAEVEDFCDEVAIIHKGEIVFQSETKEIRNKVKNELTKETYNSLEEIFIDLTTENEEEKTLSWL